MRTIIQFHDNQTGSWVALATLENGYIHVPRVGDHLMFNDVRCNVEEVCTVYKQNETLHYVYVSRLTHRALGGAKP